MGRLIKSSWERHAPDGAGTVRVDHDDCPAGVDTRRRLYVTRKEDGSIIAYCHNCGNSGFHGGGSRFRSPSLGVPLLEIEEKELIMPERMIRDRNYWPKEMFSWLKECGIHWTLAEKYGICYDALRHRAVIPKLNSRGELVQYQSRRLVDDGSPKYLTNKLKNEHASDPIGSGGKTCIIVEDMISAIRLVSLGYDAVPLFTDTMKSETMLTLVGKYDTIIVWLDNDSVTVNRHADTIVTGFRLVNQKADRTHGLSDPKRYRDDEIKDVIAGVITRIHK